MDLDVWTLNTVFSKWLIYGACAAAIGGPGIAALLLVDGSTRPRVRTVLRYTGIGCAVGLLAVAANFFLQVGAFADNGLKGLFDAGIMVLLWQTAIGDALTWRVLGFAALLFLSLVVLRWPQSLASTTGRWTVSLSVLVGIGLIGTSYAAIGHSAEHGLGARLLVIVHVLGVMWWIGALIPLWLACSVMPVVDLRVLMHRFGQFAAAVLFALLACGVTLLVLFLRSPDEMVTTPYGLALSAKTGVVFLLLVLAALHKWWFVPRLTAPAAALRLKTSIGIEFVLAALILALSAVLSTVLGPAGLA